MKIFDTHAHYNDERFNDYEGGMDKAVSDSYESGVCGFINCGTDPESSLRSIEIAHLYENAYAAVGIHPEACEELAPRLLESLDKISALLSEDRVVALGEIGLEYHWEIDRDLQQKLFRYQMEVAREHNVPVIVHDREAHGPVLDIIKEFPDVIGVMHGYSGSAEMVREFTRLGWYIAFGGPVTYKNAEKVREACRAVPLDRILIETDCPYLPPVPHRGEINLSKNMIYTLQAMANTRGEERETLSEAMLQNTMRLFNIKLI